MQFSETKSNAYLVSDPLKKLLFKFATPCALSTLVGALYGIVDQIFIGNSVGYLGNAAINVVYPYTVIAFAIGLMLGDGASTLFSVLQGGGENDKVHRCAGNCVLLSAVLGIALMSAGFIFMDEILTLFGITPDSYELASQYMKIICVGIPFYVFSTSLCGIIRADGAPKYAMIAISAGGIFNIIFDPILIFGFGMGMKGAAIATIAGQSISFVIVLAYLLRPRTFKWKKEAFIPEARPILLSCKIGLTSLATQISIVITIAILNNLIVKYGAVSKFGSDIPLAVNGIVMKVFGIVVAISAGGAAGSQPVFAYNFGAMRYDRLKLAYKYMLIANIILGVISTVAFEFFPNGIISIFGSESELYNEYARLCFRIFLGSIMLTIIIKSSAIFLQCVGASVNATILTLVRDLVLFAPLVILFAYLGGVVGMLWAAIAADLLSMFLLVFFVKRSFTQMDKAFIRP